MKILLPRSQEPEWNIRVATPCHASWEDMDGDDRARFCQECSKHVYNLSAITRAEAENLIREKEGNLCGRFYRRTDGTILHREDCPVGLAARQWRKVKNLAGALASVVLSVLGLSVARADDSAGNKKAPIVPPGQGVTMGVICPPSPTPTPSATPKPKSTPAHPSQE